MRLDELSAEHYTLLEFWLKFWLENKSLLLDGDLKIYTPEANYSMAEAEMDNRKISVCYNKNIVKCSSDEFIAVNGTGESYIAVRANGDFEYLVLDCKGACVDVGDRHIDDITIFDIQQSGVLTLKTK